MGISQALQDKGIPEDKPLTKYNKAVRENAGHRQSLPQGISAESYFWTAKRTAKNALIGSAILIIWLWGDLFFTYNSQ